MNIKSLFILKWTNWYKRNQKCRNYRQLHLDGAYESHCKKPAEAITAGQRNISLLFYKWRCDRDSILHIKSLLKRKCIAVLYGIDRFLFWVCASSHSKVMAFFLESCMKKGKWWTAICNYKQPYKNPCVSSTKLIQGIKYSLCYSESIMHILDQFWMKKWSGWTILAN